MARRNVLLVVLPVAILTPSDSGRLFANSYLFRAELLKPEEEHSLEIIPQ
jgi:hypothetical protein